MKKVDEIRKKLKADIASYCKYVSCIYDNDESETVMMMDHRDGIQEALDQLKDRVDIADYLREIQQADKKLREQASIVAKELDTHYRPDGIPRSHWWWYLDETENRVYSENEVESKTSS